MTDPFPGEDRALQSLEGASAVVLLPTLNEASGLPRTLLDLPFGRLGELGWEARPLVIDGGSTDGTLRVAEAWGVPYLRQRGRGKGGAIREALAWLAEHRVRYAAVLDADGTYPGSAVPGALELLRAGDDMVIGVRRPAVPRPEGLRDLVHRVGNSLLSYAAAQRGAPGLMDVCSGFWAVDVERAARLDLVSDGFDIEAELFMKAYRRGWRVGQIPIQYSSRLGDAKLHAARDGLRILRGILRFGQRAPRDAARPRPKAPSILRDLLLMALSTETRGVVVSCPPSDVGHADLIARQLRRHQIASSVVVRDDGAPAPRATPASSASSTSLLPQLPAATPAVSPPLTFASFRLGRTERVIYVDLSGEPAPSAQGHNGPDTFGPSMSGGFRLVSGEGGRALLPVQLLVSRLDPTPGTQDMVLLRANGFRAIREGRPASGGGVPDSGYRPGPVSSFTGLPAGGFAATGDMLPLPLPVAAIPSARLRAGATRALRHAKIPG